MQEKSIINLATPQGRIVLQRYWRDLIVEQRNLVIPSLLLLWKSAVRGNSIDLTVSGERYAVGQGLGLRLGTRVFMEEIVVRHYFNNVQALVYLGAVMLLIFLALRFANLLSEQVALIGIGIEVLMLLMLFTVLFYSPDDDLSLPIEEETENGSGQAGRSRDDAVVIREVLDELEDIGGTYATLGMKLESVSRSQEEALGRLADKVDAIQGLGELRKHSERLERTNVLLERLSSAVIEMNDRVDLLVGKEIEFRVRQELERRVNQAIGDGPRAASSPEQNRFEQG
jgi:hypothetical protein